MKGSPKARLRRLPVFYDPARGEVLYEGESRLLLSAPTINVMIAESRRLFGSGAEVFWFNCGKAAGKARALKAPGRYTAPARRFAYVARFLLSRGWGRLQGLKITPANEVVMRVGNSVTTRGVRSDGPNCYFMKGVFAGAYEAVFGVEAEAAETTCAAMGSPYCTFEFKRRHPAGG